MIETSLIGVLFAIGFIWPVHKLSISLRRKINGYAFAADISVGALMAFLFFGTQGGMIIATIATVIFTAYLAFSETQIGAEHLTLRGWKDTSDD